MGVNGWLLVNCLYAIPRFEGIVFLKVFECQVAMLHGDDDFEINLDCKLGSVAFLAMSQIGQQVHFTLHLHIYQKRFKNRSKFSPNRPRIQFRLRIARYFYRFSDFFWLKWKSMAENPFSLAILFSKLFFVVLAAIFKSCATLSDYIQAFHYPGYGGKLWWLEYLLIRV